MNKSILNSRMRALLVLSLGGFLMLEAYADSVEIGGLYYELDSSTRTAKLTYQSTSSDNYASLPATVEVPSSVTNNGISFTVTEITDRAFANCTALESISIPSTVTSVGSTMNSRSGEYLPFFNCTSLKTVRLEDGTEPLSLGVSYYSSYSKGLFYSAPLEEVYIGRNLTYEDYNQSNTFNSRPSYYGYSAFYGQSKLTKVTIGQAVTEIPAYLFYKNESLTLMTLPKVETIGEAAFRECSKLTTLNLGNSLTTVGDEAFYGCSNVTKLTFPNTTESIGNSAFYNCTSVTEVTVGNELKSIGSSGFYGCGSFTALILPDTFTTMGESAFEGCTKLTLAKLGTSLTAVPAKAFKNCISLSEMVVPASTETIGDQAFYNDSGLATITMNEGLKTIGSEVFWNNSGVMQFTIPGTVTSMGTNCFYGCTRTTYLTFSDGAETLAINNSNTYSSKIDELTSSSSYSRCYDYFYDCPIRFLTLGRNITYQYSDSQSIYDIDGTSLKRVTRASAPFVNKTDLRSVTIGPNVTFLYHHLFDGCENISTLKMGENIESIYTYAFKNCDKLAGIDFPEPLRLIDSYAFNNCDILASTTFQESSTHELSINDASFKECVSLTGVTFPGQLNKLGNSTYSSCPVLKDVVFNDNKSFQPELTIESYTFEKCPQIETLSFPGRLTSIGNYTFTECTLLKQVAFEDSNNAVTLGYGAKYLDREGYDSTRPLFGDSYLETLYLGRNVEYQATSTYGYSPFYNQNWLTDVRFSQAGTVTYCNDYLLYGVNNCESLLLPESLKTIGKRTFAKMTDLDGITIPNSVTEIGEYAFTEDKALKQAKLSTSCAWLKEGLFSECDSLTAIVIPPVVTKMDRYMFKNCKSLASATFEGSSDVLEIGYGSSNSEYGLFRDCPLETLNLDRWLTYNTESPSRSPFYSIAELKNLTLGENVGIVDKYMFSYCTGLEELHLPDNIESVGLWGFRGCSALKNVRFSQKLSQVSDYGFSECTSLDNVEFPASMTSVADNSFSNCTSLKKLDLGQSLMIIGPAAFKNDSALEEIEIPETLYGLGVEAFANCTSLPYVAIKGITSVGRQAFEGCSGLQWVSLSDKTTSLGENSFAGCYDIRYVKSYAQMPPEGLVNFAEEVPAHGTLFVPSGSEEYYQFSPTWENWLDIRPLNNNVMVSSVTLDKSEITFKATETEQLSATVGGSDATDKGILWRSADETVATVDVNGLVTAVAVGETTVMAVAVDGSGVSDECHVIVGPTMVETITLNSASTVLKKGRMIELTAAVTPVSATDTSCTWQSSDESIATVDEDGIVTSLSAGSVDITATANDGSNVYASITLTVTPPTKGDSNDDDRVTISDAVNTANYAMGYEVENFYPEAADVNGDDRVTVADASATVTIVLNQPEESAMFRIRSLAIAEASNIDELIIDDFALSAGETITIPVYLADSRDYVAMQGDIIVPQGMKIVEVNAGMRAENSHKIATRHFDNGNVRFTLFDLNNSAFMDNDAAVIEIIATAETDVTGDLTVANILGSDSNAREYVLASAGGANLSASGVDGVSDSAITIAALNGSIYVYNAEGKDIAIIAADGSVLSHFTAGSAEVQKAVASGVYVVTVGNTVKKVMVK